MVVGKHADNQMVNGREMERTGRKREGKNNGDDDALLELQ